MEALSALLSRDLRHPDQPQTGSSSPSRFRLMLVHHGLQQLDHAISDLQSRSFPPDSEVLVISVAELFRTPLHLVGKDTTQADYSPAVRRHRPAKHKKTQLFFDKLESIKRQAQAKLRAAFPDWHISFERPLGWQPSLIYLSAFNQSSISNAGLSEIIGKISIESNIPLIVARAQLTAPSTRRPALVAFDGPASAAAALKSLQCSPTDRGKNIHLMFYKDPLVIHAERWSAGYEEPDREWIDSQLVRTKSAFEALGYRVSNVTDVGNTADAILNVAKRVDAESILIATGPVAGLGSLSTHTIAVTVAAQADCSVEIAFSGQPPWPTATLQAITGSNARTAWQSRNDARAGMASAV